MKTSLSLVQLAETIERQAKTKLDYVAPAPAIVMNPDASVTVAPANLFAKLLTSTAHKQLGEISGIPADYYDRMRTADPALLSTNVNRWMSTLQDAKKQAPRRHLVRTLDGQVRALLSDSYQRIDNYEVFEVVMGILVKVPGLRVVSAAVTENRMHIKAVSEEGKLLVPGSKRGVGDIVEKGVAISNSETGLGSLSVSPFANFLICTNGMVRNDSRLRQAHLGRRIDASVEGLLSDTTKKLEDGVVLSKVKDVLSACFDQDNFAKFIDKMGATTQQKIDGDVNAAVEALGPTLNLQVGERQSVLRHLIEGGDLSRFGLVNAVTRTAEDVESYDRATELEAAGFRLADLAQHDWLRVANAKPIALAA
jgi:hypothetical protein